VNVSTGAFEALTAQVAEMAERVGELAERDFDMRHTFAAGYAAGEADTRAAMLGRAAETSRTHVRLRGGRPSHLRAVPGGPR